jgi:hypothetical protein
MRIRNERGINYLVLSRKKGKQTEKCPFCGTGHIHGYGDGHRVAHCATGHKESAIVDGIEVFEKHGYYIETIC